MDELEITLTCGYTTTYGNLRGQTQELQCMVCKSHMLNTDECLNLPRNRMLLKQKEFQLEKEKFENSKKYLEIYKEDPYFYIEESLDKIIKQLDLKRVQLIEQLTEKVNENYSQLRNTILTEHSTKKSKFDRDILQVETFEKDLRMSNITEEMDFEHKMNLMDKNLSNIKEKTELISAAISDLKEENYVFVPNNTPLNIEELFGRLMKKEEHNDNKLSQTLQGHDDWIMDLRMFGNTNMLSASWDNSIKLWETKTGLCVKTFSGHKNSVNCVCVLNNELFASGSFDSTIKIWNTNSGECVQTLTDSSLVYCLKLLKSGYLISGSNDCTIKRWNYMTGDCKTQIKGHEGTVRFLEETQDEKILSGSDDETIRLWDQKGMCLKVFKGHHYWVLCGKIINQNLFVSGSADRQIKIWNIETGECVNTLNGHSGVVASLKMFKNDKLLSGSWDGTIKMWNIETGACLKTIQAHNDKIRCLEINSNGEIFSGSNDGTVKIWFMS